MGRLTCRKLLIPGKPDGAVCSSFEKWKQAALFADGTARYDDKVFIIGRFIPCCQKRHQKDSGYHEVHKTGIQYKKAADPCRLLNMPGQEQADLIPCSPRKPRQGAEQIPDSESLMTNQ